MNIVFAIIAAACLVVLVITLINNKKLEKQAAAADEEAARLRQYCETETRRIYDEAQASLGEAQKLSDQQLAEMNQEVERVRQHYQSEATQLQTAADALLAKAAADVEALRKYEGLKDAEAVVQRQLADAVKEAENLRTDAQLLLDQARAAAADERVAASEQAEQVREQANVRLDHAIREASRIVAEAEKRAQQIGGDAYTALRDKQLLEQTAEAIRNVIEGYGDRYVVPPHSVLDDFAEKFGYDEAGRTLKAAREQSRRMVEQGLAAACDYVESNRRNTAIQFVIIAFNGYVDSILSRVKQDNYGTLEQKIKDAFGLVNHNGSAFRDARILPAYLDARLAELKWAAKVQELAQRLRDEQRAEREEMRDRELAEQERLEKEREAAKLVEMKENALKEAEKEMAEKLAHATDAQKAQYEETVKKLRKDLAEATATKLSIAQQTRVGHIYIISNEGSFGPGVYKIGLTRRDPEVRVDELYSASVPFEFDIHGVIRTENAPALEYKLHRQFLALRMNKKNFHKEFFRLTLKEIRQEVERLVATKELADTPQWRETEAGKVVEWQESRRIENDPQEREKWLKTALADADEKWRKHERRLAKRKELVGAQVAKQGGNGAPNGEPTASA
jgi:hypothetical protein